MTGLGASHKFRTDPLVAFRVGPGSTESLSKKTAGHLYHSAHHPSTTTSSQLRSRHQHSDVTALLSRLHFLVAPSLFLRYPLVDWTIFCLFHCPQSTGIRNNLSSYEANIVASPASTQTQTGAQRRRRTSSVPKPPPPLNLQEQRSNDRLGATSGLPTGGFGQPLPAIPGTPYGSMSLSRSPSPRRGGGWSSPGLTSPYDNASGKSSPRKTYGDYQINGSASGDDVTWASAKARSEEVKGYPSFSTRNQGFFSRHARKISTSLPTFSMGARRNFSDKEKLGRGRWPPMNNSRTGRFLTYTGRLIWRLRLRLGIVLGLILAIILFYVTRKCGI